ncbi:MAG TPA: integron integrase, partial [Anaerolineales bacterium]|nr:integron integrase [Anaerolineales bacterium]
MQTNLPPSTKQKRLLDQVRDALRTKHYSYRTEQAYIEWIKRFILFHGKRHPKDMGASEVHAYITYLAVERNIASSTQNQALSAIAFLYKHVLQKDIDLATDLVRPLRPERLPTTLSHQEAMIVLNKMTGVTQLMAKLLYGSGLRITECLRLRVKDLDFGNHQLIVRDGKGEKDRRTILPDSLYRDLQAHLQIVKAIHQRDIKEGFGETFLPYALERKYPNALKEFSWQYVFPASVRSIDPLSKRTKRHHLDATVLQKAIRHTAQLAGINKP